MMSCRPPFTVQLCLAAFFSLALIASFCSALIYSAEDIVIEQSRKALKDQTDVITHSLIQSAGATFEVQMKLGVSALLMPLANSLRDADSGTAYFRNTPFPYSPLVHYFDPDLKPPLTSKNDDPAVSFPGIMERRNGAKSISKRATSNWITNQFKGLAPDSPGVTAFLNVSKFSNAKILNMTSYMDYFSPIMWEQNPEFSSFYIGAPNKITNDGLFRAFPGTNLSPVFCGAMWDTPEFFKENLYPVLDDNLIVISNVSIKDIDLKAKKIETVDGISVSSRADVFSILATTQNAKVLVTWWQYDPTKRGWYSGAIERTQQVMGSIEWTTEISKGIYFGGPYKDASSGVWMISASKAVFPQANCKGGAPECGTMNKLDILGVSSFDMYIPVLNSITSKIRSRDNGEGHLFHVKSGSIVSSPQWAADTLSTKLKMADVFINTVTFGEDNVRIVSSKDEGYFTYDNSIFSWVKVLDGRYAVIIQTPLKELYASIDGKVKQIKSGTEKTFGEVMIVCLLCSLIIGGFIALLGVVAVPLLRATAKQAERVVLNLGGDLFSGVQDDIHGRGTGCASKLGGLAEVTMLWTGFHSMLEKLAAKRVKKRSSDELNPLFRDDELLQAISGWTAPWETKGSRTQVEKHVEKAKIEQELNQEVKEVRIPFWSSAVYRIMGFVGIPFVVGLAIALGLSASTVRHNVNDWLLPIRKTLTDEERKTLPIRLEAAAETLAFLFRRHENSLLSYRDLVERTWNSGFGLYPSGHFSAIGFSEKYQRAIYPNFLSNVITPDKWVIESLPSAWPYSNSVPGGGHKCKRMKGEIRNYWVSGWYGNLNNYSTTGWKNPLLTGNWTVRKSEQEVMSLADPFVRELYFANDLTYIYTGFEETESFRSFPLDDSRWLVTWEGVCLRDKPMSDWNSEHLSKRSGYTPLCRGWYELARQLDGNIAHNGIDVSASTGLLYLALSVALKDFTGKMFGVAAVEASLDELQVILSETILVSGYLFLGDLDGSLIIHPELASSAKSSIKDMEFACDGLFFEKKWSEIIGSESGMYEHVKCGETWLIYWQLVYDTKYISFLTVPLSDTEIPADEVWQAVSSTINVIVGLCVGLSLPIGVGILFTVAWLMSSSLKNLARAVNEIAVAPENDITLPKCGIFHSSEFVMILTNIKQLLAALRFGNQEWNKSKPEIELENILELEKVMVELQNHTGLGVVQNNHANVLRQIAKSRKWEATNVLTQAASIYTSAIDKARNDSNINNRDFNPPSSNPAIEMTNLKTEGSNAKVLSRMLGLALVRMDQHVVDVNQTFLEEAMDIFERVIENYEKIDDWKGLAALGYLITSHQLAVRNPTVFHEVVRNSNFKSQAGLQKYIKFSGKLVDSDYSAVCKLCYNIWWMGRNVNFILWPLVNIPQIPKGLLYRLAFEISSEKSKQGSGPENIKTPGLKTSDIEGEGENFLAGEPVASAPSWNRVSTFEAEGENEGKGSASGPSPKRIQQVVDLHMSRQFTGSWKNQISGSKAIFFVLDASGSMAGSRLRICKESIRNILLNFVSDNDCVGLIAFASYTQVLFEMTPKKNNLQFMLQKLDQLSVFGSTSFYDAMLEAVQMLCNVDSDSYNRWIITLTDGEDTGSKVDRDGNRAANIIQEQRLNVGCITVGNLPAHFITIIDKYISRAKNGMHVEASDTRKIAGAFEQIAQLIDGGLNECL